MDEPLESASAGILQSQARDAALPVVRSFFDVATCTASYVVHDPVTLEAAIIDPVMAFDASSGHISLDSAHAIIAYVESEDLNIEWLLETHAHADHLTASAYLQGQIGGKMAIGRGITEVQRIFGDLYNLASEFKRDGSQFDHLFEDGEAFSIGSLDCWTLNVPGHTPADVAYVIGDAVFCGDTIFMPDYGTARADFPGGDASQLYRSIRRLLSLPDSGRLFLCHDYKAPGRDTYVWETTVGAERMANVHVREGVTESEFVVARNARDATLAVPKLILPAIQVNMRGGELPPPESNGTRYLKIPLDTL
ncbi:MBL fold metallo-hydrolase [Paraburkholderia sp. SOS3]|uniref:MBL fold metallo-hydrolase n=1 Tax=Paraburkholderia sp. SOS3 TaxID=1926494 RepID=UPI0009473FF3|nr:MBL fold metallo-hydrolase [Paraburkholderia sp. SOS3]APR35698.1 MBL fold metallo-hydrolase [Paraburkholderia sp. SOS3]